MLDFLKTFFGFYEKDRTLILRTEENLLQAFNTILPNTLLNENVLFFCIGTNHVNGDSLGPLVGSLLEQNGYTNVLGTIQNPITAVNLIERLNEVPGDKTVIAIDAAIGTLHHLNSFSVVHGPILPGSGVGRNLPEVGDYGIMAVVEVQTRSGSLLLSAQRYQVLYEMAQVLSSALMKQAEA